MDANKGADAGKETVDAAASRLMGQAHLIAEDLNTCHKQLHEIAGRLQALEDEVDRAGLPAAKMAMREAYGKLVEAGRGLVDAHIRLNIPPKAWGGGTPAGA